MPLTQEYKWCIIYTVRYGMIMMYAADEKGDKKAADAAKYAAYLKTQTLGDTESASKTDAQTTVKTDAQTASKTDEQTPPKAEQKNQTYDDFLTSTGLKLLGNNITAEDIKVLQNNYSQRNTKKDKYGLSGDDLNIPVEERSILADYKKEYAKAEEESDYIKMNRIHKKAAEFRQQYYDYKDDYDYTHGGMYDIYTNFDDSEASYDENGHYEYVYRFDTSSIKAFFNKADDFISETITASDVVKDIVWEIVEDALKKKLSKSAVTKYTIISGILTAGEIAHVYLQCVEAISFIAAKKYCEELTKKYDGKNIDYYVYLLNGGNTTELKIRVVDKSTRETLVENSIDIHQDRSYNSCIESADENGNLASVNRRHWKYSYLT